MRDALRAAIELACCFEHRIAPRARYPRRSLEATFKEAVRYLQPAADTLRETNATLALADLAETLSELYAERKASKLTTIELSEWLRAAWRMHPAPRLALHDMNEDAFVDHFSASADGQPMDLAVELIADWFETSPSTVNALKSGRAKRPPPFGTTPNDVDRAACVLSVLYPDVDVRGLAKKLVEWIQDDRSRRGERDYASSGPKVIEVPTWPTADVRAELKNARGKGERFSILARYARSLGLPTAEAIEWAYARYVPATVDDGAAFRDHLMFP